MSALKVSMVIPALNMRKYIGACIENALAQTCPPDEIIVVDDGSTDGTPEAVPALPNLRVIRQQHGGVAAARNRGIREAAGNLIAFQDADDLWLPEKTALQKKLLTENPEWQFVAARSHNFYDPEFKGEKWMNPLEFDAEPLLPSGLMIRRSFFYENNFWFEETLSIGEDTDFFIRLRDNKVCGKLMDEALAERRLHETNLTRSSSAERKNVFMQMIRNRLKQKKEGPPSNEQ